MHYNPFSCCLFLFCRLPRYQSTQADKEGRPPRGGSESRSDWRLLSPSPPLLEWYPPEVSMELAFFLLWAGFKQPISSEVGQAHSAPSQTSMQQLKFPSFCEKNWLLSCSVNSRIESATVAEKGSQGVNTGLFLEAGCWGGQWEQTHPCGLMRRWADGHERPMDYLRHALTFQEEEMHSWPQGLPVHLLYLITTWQVGRNP